MDFDNLKEVVKQSQIATLRTQTIMLKVLGDNTNTDYDTAIREIDEQIEKIEAL